MIPVITVEGATASGKTDLAIALALELGTSIISADSRQVYRGLNIGTAKPTQEQMASVCHYLVDIRDPRDSYNAGSFAKDADAVIHELVAQGRVPIVCGGTGLYIRALLDGLCELPVIAPGIRQDLLARLAAEGLAPLYNELTDVDPAFSASISANDQQRILRGLEVYYATGIPLSRHWENQSKHKRYMPFRIYLDPPRETLYQRINARARLMVTSGLVEEVKSLLDAGYGWLHHGMNTLGYKEFQGYFAGQQSLELTTNLIAQHTRNYAKRQLTWYRKQNFDLTLDDPNVSLSKVLDRMQATGKFI